MNIPHSLFELPVDTAHILCVNISAHNRWLESGLAMLAPDEKQRVSYYHNPIHAQYFAHTRILLRIVLARFLGMDPATIQFGYGKYGKPVLQKSEELHFNLSHCGSWVAYGFCRKQRIGIDLESPANCEDGKALAPLCLSARELIELEVDISNAERFCNIWTRKEALLKAAGLGLDSMKTTCALDQGVILRDEHGNLTKWNLSNIKFSFGHILALATEGYVPRHVTFQL